MFKKAMLTATIITATLSICDAGPTDVLTAEPVAINDPAATVIAATVDWGWIEVIGHDGTELVAHATVEGEDNVDRAVRQGRLRDHIRLEVIERNGRIDIELPSTIPGFYGVRLELAVPRTVGLELRLERGGEISVDGVQGPVDAVNLNGSIRLEGLAGPTVAEARNGAISAEFGRVPDVGVVSLISLNGSIDAVFPADLGAFVRARTNNGGVESDFEIVDGAGSAIGATREAADPGLVDLAPRLVTGTIGAGGLDMYLFTANGSVSLSRVDG